MRQACDTEAVDEIGLSSTRAVAALESVRAGSAPAVTGSTARNTTAATSHGNPGTIGSTNRITFTPVRPSRPRYDAWLHSRGARAAAPSIVRAVCNGRVSLRYGLSLSLAPTSPESCSWRRSVNLLSPDLFIVPDYMMYHRTDRIRSRPAGSWASLTVPS